MHKPARILSVLKGHTQSVVSLDSAPASGARLLASSSEDGTVRVWDLVSLKSTVLQSDICSKYPESMGTVRFHPDYDSRRLFVSNGSCLIEFDLRQGKVLNTLDVSRVFPTATLTSAKTESPLIKHEEDNDHTINSFDINPDRPSSICLPLDSGDVVVCNWSCANVSILDKLPAPDNDVLKVMQQHENIAACSVFNRYYSKKQESLIISGGFDCFVRSGRLAKTTKVFEAVNITTLLSHNITKTFTKDNTQRPESMTMNPPFVVSLATSHQHTYLAFGLGNGNVGAVRILGSSKHRCGKRESRAIAPTPICVVPCHSAAVTSLKWVPGTENSSVVSAGCDRRIAIATMSKVSGPRVTACWELLEKPNDFALYETHSCFVGDTSNFVTKISLLD